MNGTVQAAKGEFKITDMESGTVPYISSTEDFERLALICDWYDTKAGSVRASNASYAAAQGAIWAITAGEWHNVDSILTTVNKHVPGTATEWVLRNIIV